MYFSRYERDLPSEIHYLSDPKDEGLKPKIVEMVFDENTKKQIKNKHSA